MQTFKMFTNIDGYVNSVERVEVNVYIVKFFKKLTLIL